MVDAAIWPSLRKRIVEAGNLAADSGSSPSANPLRIGTSPPLPPLAAEPPADLDRPVPIDTSASASHTWTIPPPPGMAGGKER